MEGQTPLPFFVNLYFDFYLPLLWGEGAVPSIFTSLYVNLKKGFFFKKVLRARNNL